MSTATMEANTMEAEITPEQALQEAALAEIGLRDLELFPARTPEQTAAAEEQKKAYQEAIEKAKGMGMTRGDTMRAAKETLKQQYREAALQHGRSDVETQGFTQESLAAKRQFDDSARRVRYWGIRSQDIATIDAQVAAETKAYEQEYRQKQEQTIINNEVGVLRLYDDIAFKGENADPNTFDLQQKATYDAWLQTRNARKSPDLTRRIEEARTQYQEERRPEVITTLQGYLDRVKQIAQETGSLSGERFDGSKLSAQQKAEINKMRTLFWRGATNYHLKPEDLNESLTHYPDYHVS